MQEQQVHPALGYLALSVRDPARSAAFYCRLPGLLRTGAPFALPGAPKTVWLRAGSVYLALIAAADDASALPVRTGVGIYPRGFHHMCLSVAEIEPFYHDVCAQGLTIERPLQTGADGNRQFWLRDPDGYPVELMELSPAGLQLADRRAST